MPAKSIIFLILFVLVACRRHAQRQGDGSLKDSTRLVILDIPDSSAVTKQATLIDTTRVAAEGEIHDVELDSGIKRITASDYENIDKTNKTTCVLDSNGFVAGLGLSVESHCDDICETYIGENDSGKKMLLPAEFDTGLLGLLVSPGCTRFVIYSSYDMPDYNKYYPDRSLLTCYEFTKDAGLKAIGAKITYSFKQWSISEVKWINERSIALKLYDGSASKKIIFKYFKADI